MSTQPDQRKWKVLIYSTNLKLVKSNVFCLTFIPKTHTCKRNKSNKNLGKPVSSENHQGIATSDILMSAGFSGGSAVKNWDRQSRDMGFIRESGRYLREGNGNSLQ